MPITYPDFLVAVQWRAARVALGSSALRGQGAGVAGPARRFLSTLPLADFAVANAATFEARLASSTRALRRRFPRGAGSWGLARKLLNIFLREALYTSYLEERYHLQRAERLFEVPLDSITADRILASTQRPLSPWPGVKHLTWRVSAEYQACALSYARREGVARIHLDALWWGVRKPVVAA